MGRDGYPDSAIGDSMKVQWHGWIPARLYEALRLAAFKQHRSMVAIVIEALARHLGVKV